MHCIQRFALFERRCYLTRGRPLRIEHDGADFRPQVFENCLEIGNERIDEQNFRYSGHTDLLSVRIDIVRELRLKGRCCSDLKGEVTIMCAYPDGPVGPRTLR